MWFLFTTQTSDERKRQWIQLALLSFFFLVYYHHFAIISTITRNTPWLCSGLCRLPALVRSPDFGDRKIASLTTQYRGISESISISYVMHMLSFFATTWQTRQTRGRLIHGYAPIIIHSGIPRTRFSFTWYNLINRYLIRGLSQHLDCSWYVPSLFLRLACLLVN